MTPEFRPKKGLVEKELLQLNLTEIVKTRAGKKGKWIPRFLLRGLERVIRQDGLNDILRMAHPSEGSDFSRKVIDYLDITLEVEGLDNIPALDAEGHRNRYMFASNHPLGGLDGIALVKVLGEHLGDDNIRVMVNDLLMNVTPLAGVFLPTNKFGKKGARESSRLLGEALESGKSIVMFPAGLVSRLRPDGGIRDLEWKKTFVTKALEHGMKIVPIRFEALNTMRFYRTAKWRKKLGIKVNIEQALLPGEVFRSRGKRFKISILLPVDPAVMADGGMKPDAIAARIRQSVV